MSEIFFDTNICELTRRAINSLNKAVTKLLNYIGPVMLVNTCIMGFIC